MVCTKCGGSMSPNPRKLPTNKQPDFLCNQDNGACGSTTVKDGKTYNNVTGAWKPKEGGFQQYAQRPTPVAVTPTEARPMVKNPNGDGFVKGADWDKIGEQKNRSNLAAAVLHGKEVDWKLLQQLEAWVISGKTPAELVAPEAPIDIDNIPF